MPLVARADRRQDGHRFPDLSGHVVERHDVPGQRPARERPTWTEVGPTTDPRLAPQPHRHLRCVGADVLAQATDLVDERDGEGEEGVQGVLHHLGGFRAHHDQLGVERPQQGLQRRPGTVVTHSDDHPPGRSNASIALPSLRFSGEYEKRRSG